MNQHKDSKIIWIVHPVCLAFVIIIEYRLKSSALSHPAGLLTSGSYKYPRSFPENATFEPEFNNIPG